METELCTCRGFLSASRLDCITEEVRSMTPKQQQGTVQEHGLRFSYNGCGEYSPYRTTESVLLLLCGRLVRAGLSFAEAVQKQSIISDGFLDQLLQQEQF